MADQLSGLLTNSTTSPRVSNPKSPIDHKSRDFPILEAALGYAERGWPIFPCDPNPQKPFSKRPLVSSDRDADGKNIEGTGWKVKATTDPHQIRLWWKLWPDALIGCSPGRCGGFVIDLDPRDETVGEVEARLVEALGEVLPTGPRTITQSGGRHLWFRRPDGGPFGNSAFGIRNIDVRCDLGYVILPPSTLRNGNRYSWEAASFDPKSAPELPKAVLELIEANAGKAKAKLNLESVSSRRATPTPLGENSPAVSNYVRAACTNIASRLASETHNRGTALYKAGCLLGTFVEVGVLSEVEAAGILMRAAEANGLLAEDGRASVEREFRRGLERGREDAGEMAARLREIAEKARSDQATGTKRLNVVSEISQSAVNRSTEWPDVTPIVASLPPVETFRPEMLPEPLRAYICDVAERQQSPVDFVAVTAIVGLAAIVGNRVRMAPKSLDDWQVAVNLWGAVIGRSSMMKTPAMRAALGSVYAIEEALMADWENEKRLAKVEEIIETMDQKSKRRNAEKALKAGNRDEARELLSVNGDSQEAKPRPRIVVNDCTVESLGELLNENPLGLLLVRDELNGWLSQLMREEHQRDRAFYLEAYNGDDAFTYDRISRGSIRIEHATVSVIGGIQPSRISPLVRALADGTADDGLLQRLQLSVWPDDLKDWKWVDRQPDQNARETFEQTFKSLHELPFCSEAPTVFRFSCDAQEMFRAWMEALQQEARTGKVSPAMESHLLKMPSTIASLALIFELVDGGRSEVGKISTSRALGWASYLRSQADRMYAAGETMAENGAKLIIERAALLPAKWTARQVQRKGWAGLTDRDVVADAIEVLMGTQHVREERELPDALGGRPATFYVWNPKLKIERSKG